MADDAERIVIPTAEEAAKFAPTEDKEGAAKPASAHSSTEEPQETVETLKTQLAECQDKLLRARAEIANTSRRLHQEKAEAVKLAGMDLARALLPVVDNLERTLDNLAGSPPDDPIVQGVRLIAGQLSKVLSDYGVRPIEAVGKAFDPVFHEAMMQDPDSELPPGTVTAEMQRGYRMHDRVLRPARVAVAAPRPAEEETEDAADESAAE